MTASNQSNILPAKSEYTMSGKPKRYIDSVFLVFLIVYIISLIILFPPVNILSGSLLMYTSIFILLMVYSPKMWLWAAIFTICTLGFVPNLFGIYNKDVIDGSLLSISMIEQIQVNGIQGRVISLPLLGLPPSLFFWWIMQKEILIPKSFISIIFFGLWMLVSSIMVCLNYMEISLIPLDATFIVPDFLNNTKLSRQWWQTGMPYTLISFTITLTFAYLVGCVLFLAVFNLLKDMKIFDIAFCALTFSTVISVLYGLAQINGIVPAFTPGGSFESTFQSQGSYGVFVGISCVYFFTRIFLFKDRVIMNVVLFLVSFLGVFINQTRTALLALITNLFIIYAAYEFLKYKSIDIMSRARKWVLVTIMIVIGVSVVLLNTPSVNGYIYKNCNNFIRNIVHTIDLDTSYANINHSRLNLWGKCIGIWKEEPVFGCGQGQLYWELKMRGEPDSAANQFILVLSELGIVGLGIFLWVIFSIGRDLLSGPLNNDPEINPYWLTCCALVFCILVQSITVHIFHFPNLPLLIGVIVAMALASSERRANTPEKESLSY